MSRKPQAVITDQDLVRVARALADPTRVQILRAVASAPCLCCGAIGREVPVRPATVSHHLRVLADAGLVETRRDGQFINVQINRRRLDEFREALACIAAEAAAESTMLSSPRTGGRR
jgi:ArsR family transcriptional regulator